MKMATKDHFWQFCGQWNSTEHWNSTCLFKTMKCNFSTGTQPFEVPTEYYIPLANPQ